MAQVKIYALKSMAKERKSILSDTIHISLMEVFKLPADKRFHRFIQLDKDDFIFPDDRSVDYLIVELIIFEGRTEETKKALIKKLIGTINNALDISVKDIEITIIETPKSNWGIRGVTGDELNIDYKIEV